MPKKIRTYIVPVRSTVTADYYIKATSKAEAHELVDHEMIESMQRQIEKAPKRPEIKNLSGDVMCYKSLVKIKE